MTRAILYLLTIHFASTILLPAQSYDSVSAPTPKGGLYVSAKYSNTSDFPVTERSLMDYLSGSPYTSSAASGGIAVGGFTITEKKLYAAVEAGFFMPSFSDPNVSGEKFYFVDLFVIHLGLSAAEHALYGIFGLGWLYHPEEEEDFVWPGQQSTYYTYHLDGSTAYGIFGLGARLSPFRKMFLSIDYKWTYSSTEAADFDRPVPGKPGWYYTDTEFHHIGNRFSIALSYVIFEE